MPDGPAKSPSTSSTLTGGGAALAACERCKRRKSRCDRSLPSCRPCEQAQLNCVYTSRRRPGFSTGHRQMLESKIRKLEEENQRLRSPAHVSPGNALSRQGPTPISSHQTGRSLDAANEEISPSRTHVRAQGRALQATYARTRRIAEQKPPLDLVITSVSVFFRHIHPWFPFLDVRRVMTEVARTQDPSLLLHGVFGASLPLLYDSRLDQCTSDSYWKYCKRRIFVETTEEPSFAALEACTVLTLDLSGMTNGPQVWSRLAVVAKLAAQLRTAGGGVLRSAVQAHDDPDGAAAEPRIEEVTQPGAKHHDRLFWAIYALDVFISVTTSQPRALSEHSLDAFLPSRAAVWTERGGEALAPENLFCHMLELLDIACAVHSVFLEYVVMPKDDETRLARWLDSFAEQYTAASAWLAGLPPHLAEPSVGSDRASPQRPLIMMMHIYSHAITIHINGLLESGTQILSTRRTFEPQPRALQQLCDQSVSAIVALVSRVGAIDQLGWPFAWSVWVAARYLLAAAYRRRAPMDGRFDLLVKCLRRLGRYWQISTKYWWLLRRAVDAYHDVLPEAASEASYPPILLSMVDLGIPTSDLEDEFRVDPVLSRPRASGTHFHGEEAAPMPDHGEANSFGLLGDEMGPVSPGFEEYLSDIWFSNPLFATSGYQQLPISDGGLEAADDWTLP